MSATLQNWTKKINEHVEIPILTKCCFCCPLRIGLITFAYLNLALSLFGTISLSVLISYLRSINLSESEEAAFPRLIADTAAMVLEIIMTIFFIVALHRKHVLMMKIFLYFEIVFTIVGFVYSLAFLTKETASELFLVLFQLVLQIYLSILIWSSIVKMQRNVAVKYMRQNEPA